jgi:hypothetical protein
MTTRPEFIEYGLRTSSPGPFRCSRCELRSYVLEGDKDQIGKLIERTLNKVAPETVRYRPAFGPYVILMMGTNLVTSKLQLWEDRGSVEETLASFWIPLVVHRNGKQEDELRMFISHILVNNPISLYTGREVYGFAKALGRFTPDNGLKRPDGELGPIRVEAYGGNFTPGRIDWLPLLDLTPIDHSKMKLVDFPWLGSLGLIWKQVLKMAEDDSIKQVFLKQFRDAGDHTKACYQAVIESDSKMTEFKMTRLRENFHRTWHVEIHPLESHPIAEELGLKTSQTTATTYEVEFEFDVLPGAEVVP